MGIRPRKILTAVALIVVTVLGGVALSLAHENIPTTPARGVLIGHGRTSRGLSYPSGVAVWATLECETCDAPTVIAYSVQNSRPFGLPHSTGCAALAELGACAPKVSLYMRDSVLLI